ncbi:hypothetical protein FQN50_009480 [Emmonsiellopsis sp. PD_5]|nr:hypothetical protein FQN50_009480 [Emmonsiellopsis sp. PD_5]
MNGQDREPTPPPPYATRPNTPNQGNGPQRQGPNANDVYEDFAEPAGRDQGYHHAPVGIQGNNNNVGYDPFGPGGGQPQAALPQALNFGEIAAPAPVHYNIFNNPPAAAGPAGGLPFPFAQAQMFGQQPMQFPQLAINLGAGPGGILDLNAMAQNLLNPPPPAHLLPGRDEPPATWAEYFAQFQFPPGQAPVIDLANLPPLPGTLGPAPPPLNHGNFGNFGNFGGGLDPFGMQGMGMQGGGGAGMGMGMPMAMAFAPPSPPASSAASSARSSHRSNRGVNNDRDPARDAPVWVPWYRVLWGDCCGF